jgi:hypothetical protein
MQAEKELYPNNSFLAKTAPHAKKVADITGSNAFSSKCSLWLLSCLTNALARTRPLPARRTWLLTTQRRNLLFCQWPPTLPPCSLMKMMTATHPTTTTTSDPSRVRGGVHHSIKIQDPLRAPVGCYNSICLDPRQCDILTTTQTGPAPPGQDPMPLVSDMSAACLRTVAVCVHVLLAIRVNSFFRLPSNRVSSFNKHSCHRISKLVTCIESSRFATTRSNHLKSPSGVRPMSVQRPYVCLTVKAGRLYLTVKASCLCLTVKAGRLCLTVKAGRLCLTVKAGSLCLADSNR